MSSNLSDHPILTISQLSNAIKFSLEATFPAIWVQGEISNCKPHTSGHLYFSLKDSQAQISAVMFRPEASLVKVALKDGMQVIVRGEINVYPQGGKYQILVREIRPVGLGELLLKLEELKIKLHKRGWFRQERKRPIPKFPKRIGVVTSPTGAAIQDILNILTRRFSNFHLIINPVKVQGENAAKEIAQAIEQFNRYQLADVLIVGRGGGSIEDLWSFNEEIVAEAIYHSMIPIISAVGHETDHCIADYVADVRAPTPSAAAELVIAEKDQQVRHLEQTKKRLQHSFLQITRYDRQRLASLTRQLHLTITGALHSWQQTVDQWDQDIEEGLKRTLTAFKNQIRNKQQLLHTLKPTNRLEYTRQQMNHFEKNIDFILDQKMTAMRIALNQMSEKLLSVWMQKQKLRKEQLQSDKKLKQLETIWKAILSQKREKLSHMQAMTDSLNPKNLLTKGYCILFSEKENSAISSVHSVIKDQSVQVILADGHLTATVRDLMPN